MKKLYIVGEITDEKYEDFSRALAKCEAENVKILQVELLSHGGDAHAALAFASRIRLTSITIQMRVIGNCASAAVLILASADERHMVESAWVMVHEDSGTLDGNATELQREANHMRELEDQWNSLLEKYTGTSANTWSKLHKDTTYLTAKQCLKLKLIDEIIEEN